MTGRLHLNEQDISLAQDKSTPADVLAILACHPIASVRIAVGANPACPEHAHYLLAIDPEKDVRCSLAQNNKIERGILQAMCEDDDDHEVRDYARRTIEQL